VQYLDEAITKLKEHGANFSLDDGDDEQLDDDELLE